MCLYSETKGKKMSSYSNTLKNFISKEAYGGILLFLATILAVIVANSSYGTSYSTFWHLPLGVTLGDLNISMSLTYWIDDGLMALFFLMVGLEIKRELIIGELSSVQKAAFPIVAAIGGMVIPAFIYVIFNPQNPIGFGIPMATDIAFALGILMLLGKRVNPALKLFLVALAVVDDLGAVLVVALVYTNQIHYEYFAHAALVYSLIWVLNIAGVKNIILYLILGLFLWIYIHAIGIHATIAGVLLAFAIPIKSKINEDEFINISSMSIQKFKDNIDNKHLLNHYQIDALEDIANSYTKVQNPLLKLEHFLHDFSAYFIMPLFAFSNAGVVIDFSIVNTHLMVVLGVVFGLLIGKPIGIFILTYILAQIDIIKKPNNITWSEVIAAGFFGGIGFTMSIFITHLAFTDQSMIDAVKLGVFIASFVAAFIGVFMVLTISKSLDS